jgi:RES domain
LSARKLPEPPPPAELLPAIELIPAGSKPVRLYQRRFGPTAFNPTEEAEGRFRPVHDDGQVVPTAYLAGDQETALAEVLLRGVDALAAGLEPRLYRRQVEEVSMAGIEVTREFRLARLRGQGLTRLHVRREELIDVGPDDYPYTARWAQALYESEERFDGIAWTSHQNDAGLAMMLWEGRVDPDRDLAPTGESLALDRDPGLDLVRQASLAAGFAFEG